MPRKRIPHRNFIREAVWMAAYDLIAVVCPSPKRASVLTRSFRSFLQTNRIRGIRVIPAGTHIYLGPVGHHSGFAPTHSNHLYPHNCHPHFLLLSPPPRKHSCRHLDPVPPWDAFHSDPLFQLWDH